MSIYYELDPVTEGIAVEAEQPDEQGPSMKKQANLLSPEAREILMLQNQNQQMKEKLTAKKEQLAWLSLKSISIGKQFMQLLKQKDDKQAVIEKAGAKLQKYKNKNSSLEQKLKVFKVENDSINDLYKYDKESTKNNYERANKNLGRILELLKDRPELKNIQELVRQTQQILQP